MRIYICTKRDGEEPGSQEKETGKKDNFLEFHSCEGGKRPKIM